jgi:glycosyltransferase involved in cell wall biosynthesis
LVTLAKAMTLRGNFAVSVVHFYPGAFESELRAAGIQTVCIGKKHRWDLVGFFIRLIATMRALRPEVIHGYLHESNLMALLLKPLCGFPKVVWGIRDSQTDAATWGILGKLSFRLNCLLSGWADQIIANSRAGRDYYISHGYPAANFEVVPNGIDVERFRPLAPLPAEEAHSLGESVAGRGWVRGTGSLEAVQIPPLTPTLSPEESADSFRDAPPGRGSLTFVMIGRLHPMKDHATFLRALAQVPEAKAVIIGNGDAAYALDMRSLAESLGITNRVEWQPARDDLASVYPTFDCLVSTSAYGEGFSNVIGEAMACGLPVITSDVGDSAWLVDDSRWVFEAGDPSALAEKMRTFLALSPDLRSSLGQTNRQRIEQHFTISTMVEATSALCIPQARQRPGVRWQNPERVPTPLSMAPQIHEPPTASESGVTAAALQNAAAPPRILWLTTALGTGGAEMMLTQIITGLPHHRHTVISLTSGGKYIEPLRAAGAEVHTLDMPTGKPTPRALWKLITLAWKAKPTVIMGWMYHGCLAAVLVKLFRLGQGRVVWNIRQSLYDLSLEKRGSAMVIKSLSWLAVFAETITYNSQLSARQHEAIGYSRTKTRLIPNGFDLTKWQVERTSKFVLPVVAKPNELGSSFYIGRFGRFTAMKDYPTFLEAAALIVKAQPQAQFILVGTGVDATNSELTTLIAKLGLQAHVHLLGERSDLPTITASLDIAVSSSAFGEGFPNVVGEAMACGVPVVATDIGDTAWVMGDTGTLVPAKDPTKLAEACLHLLNLPEAERRALGEKGRQRITEHFSLASVLQHFDELLQQGTRN